MYALILLGIIGGAFVPLQTVINGRLTRFTPSVIVTSFYSFLIGTILLLIVNLILNPAYFTVDFYTSQSYSYTWFLGGLLGVVFLTGNIILLPRIGAALTVIITVTGQMIIGLIIDTFGWFNATPMDLHFMHIIGILLLISGIIFMNARRNMNVSSQHSRMWLVFGLFTGMMPPMQTAVNGALSLETGSFIYSAMISFGAGTTALLILSIIISRSLRLKSESGSLKLKPWYFLGGPLGAVYVACNILLMPELGTTLTMMAAITGQILMGLLVDQFGLFGLPKQPVDARRIFAVIIIFSGIVLLQMF